MNRWLMRICVFLILGAIVNIAVAWIDWAVSQPVTMGHGFGMVATISPPVGWPFRVKQFSYLPETERLLWMGVILNSVFYALIIAIPVFPFVQRDARIRRRLARGLCPKCAYDLRGSAERATCPECGAAVNRMAG